MSFRIIVKNHTSSKGEPADIIGGFKSWKEAMDCADYLFGHITGVRYWVAEEA